MKKNTLMRWGIVLAALLLSVLLVAGMAACTDDSVDAVETTTEAATTSGAPDETTAPDSSDTTEAPSDEVTTPEETESEYVPVTGDGKPDIPSIPKTDVVTPNAGSWSDAIAYAKQMENGVFTYFPVANRAEGTWILGNTNVNLTYDMSELHGFTSIANEDGVNYVTSTGFAYIVGEDGTVHPASDSRVGGRTNIFELGAYYYQAHIMGEAFINQRTNPLRNMRHERVFHMYSDKLHLVTHLLAEAGDCSAMSGYGQYFDIEADRVQAVVVKDARGLHYTLDGVDWSTAEYVAFDIKDAGVFGLILPNDDYTFFNNTMNNNATRNVMWDSGSLTVTLEDGVYRIDQRIDYDASLAIPQGTNIYFGSRIYTDNGHSFDEFITEAEGERNPLTGDQFVITNAKVTASYVQSYDALRGCYTVCMAGTGFNTTPNLYFTAGIKVVGDALNRKLYFMAETYTGVVESAILIDENQNVLPIMTEVTKNFCGEMEEQSYDPGDKAYGRTYVPIYLSAGETKKFTVVNTNYSWGKFAVRQLSSVQFFSPYYHLSIGASETNCITPNGVVGKDFGLLPDFRATGSGEMWVGQPQYNAVGDHYIIRYTDADGVDSEFENHLDYIDSTGPSYVDVTLYYQSADGRVDASYRHVELPQVDTNRTLYTIRVDIKEDISFTDFKNDFLLYTFSGRFIQYGKISYLNDQNQIADETINYVKESAGSIEGGDYTESFTSDNDRYIKLGTNAPFVAYYGGVNLWNSASQEYDVYNANYGMIIKSSDIVIGGRQYDGGFVIHDYLANGVTRCDLSLDLGEVTLRAGDYIEVDMILMPWGSSHKDQTADWVYNVREDSALNPYKIVAANGSSVIEDTYVLRVMANDDGVAEFTVTGGTNITAVRVYGLASYLRPTLEEYVNGEWVAYDTTGDSYDHGNKQCIALENDGYMMHYDGDGTFSVSFDIDMTDVGAEGRTFRVTEAK